MVEPPSFEEIEKLFQEPPSTVNVSTSAPSHEKDHAARTNAILEQIEAVRKTMSWSGKNPESEQDLIAEMKLMVHCNSVPPRPQDAAEVWKSALLPRGSLVHCKALKRMVFVVKPYKSACMVWPAVCTKGKIYRHDPSAQSLEFIFVTDLDDFEEYTTETWSPMHLYKEAYLHESGYIEVVWDGTTRNIEVAQSQRGFGMIDEEIMEKYLGDLDKAFPVSKDQTIDRTTDLQLACMAAAEPGITDRDVARQLNRGFMLEHADHYADLHVDPAILADVVTKGEAKEIASYSARSQEVTAMKELMQHTRKQRMATHKFKRAPRAKYDADAKKQPRWLPVKSPTAAKVAKWIEKFIPPEIDLLTDDYNGRWRVISADLAWKSISWTKRGWESAACETVYWAWWLHSSETDDVCPFDLTDLQERFKADDAADDEASD